MSATVISPLEKAMAFGGVPAGKINTSEQAIVTGNIIANGLIFDSCACSYFEISDCIS